MLDGERSLGGAAVRYIRRARVMDRRIVELLTELERHGADHDARFHSRDVRLLNITRDTGRFLDVMVRAAAAKRILEIGTSNGYSTIWLAVAALSQSGHVTTVEHSSVKAALAAENLRRAGLEGTVSLVQADAGKVLGACGDGSVDLLFLDADRERYAGWWPDLRRALRPGGILIVDNAISHADEMAAFISLVENDGQFRTSLVPVGKGEFLAVGK